MDRQIVYIGQVPMDTDILNTNLNAYIGIGKLAADILGTSTQINGLACTQTTVPSMSVLIGPGEIYQLAAIDTSGYGSLPANSTQILKQGINLASITTTAMTAPVTVGQSINYLIEFALGEIDNGSQVLPYFDSANPSQAFSGPGNDAQPQMTNRADQVAYQIKAGTPAPTGTQTTPTPDAGYVGGFVVTIAQGQTSIINSNISVYPGAPFIPSTLGTAATQVGVQNSSYSYAVDSGTTNALAATLSPAITGYVAGLRIMVKVANTNTGASTINVNGLGAKNIQMMGGTSLIGGELLVNRVAVLIYDGTQFELQNPANSITAAQNNTYTYAADTGSANTYAVSLLPAPAAYAVGMRIFMKVANTNTGNSTVNVNSLGAKNIRLINNANVNVGDLLANSIVELIYDGTEFLLLTPNMVVKRKNVQVFPSSGTYTPSSGLIGADFEVMGGGGGSGGLASAAGTTLSTASGGGGSAPLATAYFTAAQIGASATITIGAAGIAGPAGANNGGTGGTSSAALSGAGTITIASSGGVGGTGASTGVSGIVSTAGGTGGTVTNSDKSNRGGSGCNGFYIQGSTNLFAMGGKGADSVWGQGGVSGSTSNGSGSGNAGVGYGSGGSGSFAAQAGSIVLAGSAGSPGYIVVTEYLNQ